MKQNSITVHKPELEARIIEAATEAFMREGINAVKMDDVAATLSISKRTLYEQFSNKENLLLEVIKSVHINDHRFMEQAAADSDNVLEIIMKFYEHTVLRLKKVNPLFFHDLEKYPRVNEFLESCSTDNSCEAIEFFNRGVREGYFRSDVNYEIFHLLTHTQREAMKDKKKWERFDILDIFNSILIVNMRGISTEKGLRIIDEYVEKVKKINREKK